MKKIPKTVEELEAFTYVEDVEALGVTKANQLRTLRQLAKTNSTDGYWGTGESFLGGLSAVIIWRIIIAGVFFLILVITGNN